MSGKPRKLLKMIDSLKSWNSPSSQSSSGSSKCQIDIEEKLKPEEFQFGKIARHGFPCDPRCIAFDPVQKLIAVGTSSGSIRVIGRAGVDAHLKNGNNTSAIQQIIFLVNEGALIAISSEDTVALWSIRQKQPCVVHSLSFKKEKLTTGFLSLGSKWLYVGTERGNVHFVQVNNFVLSGYIINWNKAIDLTMSHHPGAVVQIAENPQDANKLLIGYSSGFLVLWDLRGKMGEARFKFTETLYGFWWHCEGKQFATSHEHGILATWNYRQPQKPMSVIHPHAREAPEEIMHEKYTAIRKVQWIVTRTGDSMLVLAGGELLHGEQQSNNSGNNTSTSVTLMRGKKVSVVEMDAPVIDFVVLCDSPFTNDTTQPYSVAILLQNDLVLIDLLSPNYPTFTNPYAMDLHQPAVTSCFYLGECPSDLVPALYSVGMRNNSNNSTANCGNKSGNNSTSTTGSNNSSNNANTSPTTSTNNNSNSNNSGNASATIENSGSEGESTSSSTAGGGASSSAPPSMSTRDWPINGGQWGSAFSPYSELLITGHEDGSLKFWDVTSVTMSALYKLRLAKCFDLSATSPKGTTNPTNSGTSSTPTTTSPTSVGGGANVDSGSGGGGGVGRGDSASSFAYWWTQQTQQHPLEILHIQMCGQSRKLLVAGRYHALLLTFSKRELLTDVPTLDVSIDYDLQEEATPTTAHSKEKSDEASLNKVTLHSVSSTSPEHNAASLPRLYSPPARAGSRKWLPGYQPELLCQLVQTSTTYELTPSNISCIGLSTTYGILAIGTGHGLAVVDYIQKTCLLSTGTPDLYGSMDPYTRVVYKPSMSRREELKSPPPDRQSSECFPFPNHLGASHPTTSPPHRSHSEVGARSGRPPPPPSSLQWAESISRPRASSAATETPTNSTVIPEENLDFSFTENPTLTKPPGQADLQNVTAAMDEIMMLVHQTDVEVEEAVEAMTFGGGTHTAQSEGGGNSSLHLGNDWVSISSSDVATACSGSVKRPSNASSITHPAGEDLGLEETSGDTAPGDADEQHLHAGSNKTTRRGPPPRPPQPRYTLSPSDSAKGGFTAVPLGSDHTDLPQPPVTVVVSSSSRPAALTSSSYPSLKQPLTQHVDVVDLRCDDTASPTSATATSTTTNAANASSSSSGLTSVFFTSSATPPPQTKTSRFPLFSNKLWNISPMTDKGDLSQLGRSISASVSSLENICFEAISTLHFVECYTRKSDFTKQPALWIGTEMGSVLSLAIQMPQRRNTQRVIVTPSGTLFRLRGEIQCIAFLDNMGKLIQPLKTRWEENHGPVTRNADPSSSGSASTPEGSGSTGGRTGSPAPQPSEAMNGKGSTASSPSTNGDFQLAVFCSEKQARVVSLPTQQCVFKTKITETSRVLRASALLLKGSPLLAVYMANGHVLCYSLPSLRLLMDAGDCVPQPWGEEALFVRCFTFGHNAQAIYACSSTEVEKVSLSTQTCSSMKETCVDLFVPCEMPPSPKKNFIQNIFNSVGSSLDRDELFGEAAAGKASSTVAALSSNPRMERAQMSAAMAQSEIGKAKLAAIERGQRLGQLDERTQEMMNEAKSFSRNAALLAKKYEDKNKWWPF